MCPIKFSDLWFRDAWDSLLPQGTTVLLLRPLLTSAFRYSSLESSSPRQFDSGNGIPVPRVLFWRYHRTNDLLLQIPPLQYGGAASGFILNQWHNLYCMAAPWKYMPIQTTPGSTFTSTVTCNIFPDMMNYHSTLYPRFSSDIYKVLLGVSCSALGIHPIGSNISNVRCYYMPICYQVLGYWLSTILISHKYVLNEKSIYCWPPSGQVDFS